MEQSLIKYRKGMVHMKNVDELDRTQFLILASLYANGATDKYHGMTITEVGNDCEGTLGIRMTVWRKAALLVKKGYVTKGIMDGKADTYYLLEKGLEVCKGGNQK